MLIRKQVIILISFVFISATGLLDVRGQEKKVELKDKLVTVQMDKKPIFDVFIRLIYDYDVAVGFEESSLDREHDDYHFQTNIPYDEINTPTSDGRQKSLSGLRPIIENHLISVNFKDARLEDVLNDIVKQMQNYSWEINDDVVDIFPIRGRDARFKKLLDLRIHEFTIWKGAEVGVIQPLIILKLPEFKAFLKENNLYAESDRTAPWYIERPLPDGMKFSDKTFKELLNAITKSKRGGWILKTNKLNKTKDKEFIDILI